MRLRRSIVGLLVTLSGTGGCAVQWEGEVSLEAEHDAEEVVTVQLVLPPGDVSATGVSDGDVIAYRARFIATGGTPGQAQANAEAAALVWQRFEGVGRLAADLPVELSDGVRLELDEFLLPSDRALEIRHDDGDVSVEDHEGHVLVEVQDDGDIVVVGGDTVAATTRHGDVRVESPGNVDVSTRVGGVRVESTLSGRDVFVDVDLGDIDVILADDGNVDLHIETKGDILVSTPQIAHIGKDHFDREVGNGTVDVVLTARFGDVTVRSP